MGDVPGFLPSKNGLHYPNSWPNEPDITVNVGPFSVNIGNAANGLCGGMAFAVRDLWDFHLLPPPTNQNPKDHTPAFNYLVKRLIDSFDIPSGVLEYYMWMVLPTHDDQINIFGDIITLVHGTSSRTIDRSMPVVRATIDSGQPCPLGLVRVHSTNPGLLGKNHQVLAWGYTDDGPTTSVRVYDPNLPDDDTATITFDHTHPAQTTAFNYSGDTEPIYGFFPTTWYRPEDPAALLTEPSGERPSAKFLFE
jgi:hypothetical protein